MNFDDLDLKDKVVLLRLDLNVPIYEGTVSDHTRIMRVKPTIESLVAAGAKTVILSHFGRPKGEIVDKFSLKFLPPVLSKDWGVPVSFADDCIGDPAQKAVGAMKSGDVLLLENVRFHAGEEKNDSAFAKQLAFFGDVYMNDAFSVSHRAHASVHALARELPSRIGLSMLNELQALKSSVANPKRPVAAIVGGAKISTKLDLLLNLVTKMDVLILGGGMANTFMAARGWNPGASLHEADMLDTARDIMSKAEEEGCQILLPIDCVAASAFGADAEYKQCALDEVPEGWMVLDVGSETSLLIEEALENCETLVWNGPLGVFELPFAKATQRLADWVAARTHQGKIVSVAGGGDTVSALGNAGNQFTYVSTAGGAFLEWLEGKELPGVAVLAKTAEAA